MNLGNRWESWATQMLPWIAVCVPPAALLTASAVLTSTSPLGLAALRDVLFMLAVAALPGLRRGLVRIISIGTVTIFLAVQGLQLFLAPMTWLPPSPWIGALTEFSSAARPTVRNGYRRWWALPTGSKEIRFSLQSKVSGPPDPLAWQRSDSGIVVGAAKDGGGAFARITFPSSGNPYVMKTIHLASPVRGRTFAVTLALRADTLGTEHRCRGIWLQARGSVRVSRCFRIHPGPTWTTYHERWTAPSDATSRVLAVLLNDFNGSVVDVKQVHLYEIRGAKAFELGPLLPSVPSVSLTLLGPDGNYAIQRVLAPSRSWQTGQFDLALPQGHTFTRLAATLHTPSQHGSGWIRDVSAISLPSNGHGNSARLHPLPPPSGARTRLAAFFGHPNLTAHSATMLGLIALATYPSAVTFVLALLVTLGSVLLTGSRAALVGIGLGSIAIAWFRRPWAETHRKRRHWIIPALALGFLLGLVVMTHPLGVLGKPIRDAVPRTAIWQAAWTAFRLHPLTGIHSTPGGFGAYWSSLHEKMPPVTHAHNFWLQWSALYGWFGLAASLWLSIALVAVAWRKRGILGIVVVLALLLMNTVDYTLFFSAVLIPLVLFVNARPTSAPSQTLPDR